MESSNIKILTWNEIYEIFDVTENYIKIHLVNSNDTENFWYPYESGFSEEQTNEIVCLFRGKFIDAQILDCHGAKYTEIRLGTLEQHIWSYSLIYYFRQQCQEQK